jgi:hypothetical protein
MVGSIYEGYRRRHHGLAFRSWRFASEKATPFAFSENQAAGLDSCAATNYKLPLPPDYYLLVWGTVTILARLASTS